MRIVQRWLRGFLQHDRSDTQHQMDMCEHDVSMLHAEAMHQSDEQV